VYTFSCRYESFEVKFDNKHKIDEWTFDEAKSLANVEDTNLFEPIEPKVLDTQVEDGLTNCYIVVPGERVAIPVARAFVYDKNADDFTGKLHVDAEGEDYTDEFETELVWQTKDVIRALRVDGNGKDAILRVYTKRDVEGNAVVKAYKKGDTTKAAVWSWHIWVTKDDPTANVVSYEANMQQIRFMDRNLGALEATLSPASRGLYYQWGRKDPFPSEDALIKLDNSAGTLEAAIMNPSTFYLYGGISHWTDDIHYWSDKKTIYDPCPEGYKVPRGNFSPWEYLTPNEAQVIDEPGVWYGTDTPNAWVFAGQRDAYTGQMESINEIGYYWTTYYFYSMGMGAYGHEFGTTGGNKIDSYPPDLGKSVRCMKDDGW
jgi:hypothetical protein